MDKRIWALLCLWLTPSWATSSTPEGYYDSLSGLYGTEFRLQLHNIIDNHYVIPYTNGRNDDWHDRKDMDVWEALTYTDSACDPLTSRCGMIQLLYLDETRHISLANRGSGSDDSWDREHVWPKSRGFPRQSQDGYTDLHHLRPADRNLNGDHSNYGYDLGGAIVMDEYGDNIERPTTARIDRPNNSFEPPDRAKGQVARMLFYMAVRYDGDDDRPDEDMPDLVLRDENGITSDPWIGDLCTLLQWHNRFGPSDFERRRNDRVMEIQGNRNPFIDEPGWANLIWGINCSQL